MRPFPPLAISLACLLAVPPASPAATDRSGPAISLQNTVYEQDGKWHCPLCHQVVPRGDRRALDLRLQLSEWHDDYIDAAYFERHIRHITDTDLVASLTLPGIDAELRAAAAAGDGVRVSALLHAHFSQRADNGRLSAYDAAAKTPFITGEEFAREVRADPARARAIAEAAARVYTPETGFTLHGVTWGERIDFAHTYPNVSKWGVHYLQPIDALLHAHLVQPSPVLSGAFEHFFNQWYEQIDRVKPEPVIHMTVSYDFIWYELGLANRTERLINAQRLFAADLSPETTKRMLKNLLGSARWLDLALTRTPFHPYNWQTHTAHTLSYAAVAYPEFTEAARWLEHGRARMIEHLEKDILDDGGYVERSTSYAAYMFSVFHKYLVMLRHFRDDRSLLDRYLPRLEKFIEFFVLTTAPPGTNVPFNDSARNRDLLPLFREMALFFSRGDFVGGMRHAYAPSALADLPFPVAEPAVRSADFPHSRFAVMRDAWTPQSYFLMVNYGDHQNHSHADQLSLEIYANGIPIAVDAGLGPLGYLEPSQLTWYKHPDAHNMLTINRAVPEKRHRPGYDKVWSLLPRTEVFAASHDGYVPYQGARHRRHIVFAKERYWLLVDEVSTEGRGQEMEFHLHTPCVMTPIEGGFISKGDTGFVIRQATPDGAPTLRDHLAGPAQLNGLAGEPAHREIDWLLFRRALSGEARQDRMATLILPYRSGTRPEAAEARVEEIALRDPAAQAYRVTIGDREDLIVLSDGQPREFLEGLSGDFTHLHLSRKDGHLEHASLTQASIFRLPGQPEQRLATRRDHVWLAPPSL